MYCATVTQTCVCWSQLTRYWWQHVISNKTFEYSETVSLFGGSIKICYTSQYCMFIIYVHMRNDYKLILNVCPGCALRQITTRFLNIIFFYFTTVILAVCLKTSQPPLINHHNCKWNLKTHTSYSLLQIAYRFWCLWTTYQQKVTITCVWNCFIFTIYCIFMWWPIGHLQHPLKHVIYLHNLHSFV